MFLYPSSRFLLKNGCNSRGRSIEHWRSLAKGLLQFSPWISLHSKASSIDLSGGGITTQWMCGVVHWPGKISQQFYEHLDYVVIVVQQVDTTSENLRKLALIILSAVMLLLTFLGLALSVFGMQFLVYIVTGDTCVSMNQWVRNPTAHTALDDILLYVDNCPFYYNHSGPRMSDLYNPFNADLLVRACAHGEVDLYNVTQVDTRGLSTASRRLGGSHLVVAHLCRARGRRSRCT